MKTNPALNALCIVTLVLALTSCNISKKIDKWAGYHYAEKVPTKVNSNDYISFKFESTIPDNKVSVTKRTKNQFIPALFYYQWKYETRSTLNVMLPVNNFVNSFVTAANSKKIKEKLHGATLKVIINSNPADFRYNDNGWSVFLIFGAITHSKIFVEPTSPEFEIQYSIVLPSGESKPKTVSIRNPNRQKEPRFFQSLKGAVTEYLSVSDAHVKRMGQELADKIIADLNAIELVKE
jgi:hypothetical protein